VPVKSFGTIPKIDKICISSKWSHVSPHGIILSFQQKLVLGLKQYGSKIRPHVSWGLISIHNVLQSSFKINVFFRKCKKMFSIYSIKFGEHCTCIMQFLDGLHSIDIPAFLNEPGLEAIAEEGRRVTMVATLETRKKRCETTKDILCVVKLLVWKYR